MSVYGIDNHGHRINRYIVGCKLLSGDTTWNGNNGINRYIVGCKCFVLRNAFQKLVELIDT